MAVTFSASPAALRMRPRAGAGTGFDTVLVWLGLVVGALLAGLLCVVLPWWLVAVLMMTTVYPVLLYKAPWVGLFVYCVAILVSPDLKLTDVLTAFTLAFLGVRFAADAGRAALPRLQWRLLLCFMALVALSLALGLLVFGNKVSYAYRDARPFLYWLWLPVFYWLAKPDALADKKLARLLIGMAVAVAVLALVQYLFGLQIVREGRVGALGMGGSLNAGPIRVQMPGYTFVLVAFVWAACCIGLGGARLLYAVPLTLLLAAAVYVNFGRGLWTWLLVAVLLSGVVMGWRRAVAVALSVALLGGIAVGGLYLVKPAVVETAVERMVSVENEGGRRTSFGWRKLENEAAAAQIERSPLVGIGLGGEYRHWITEIREFADHTRYLHNAYVFIALKLGLPALAVLLALLSLTWWRAWRDRLAAGARRNPVWVAAMASWWPLLGLSLTQPELVTSQSVVLMCLLMAVMLVVGAPRAPRAHRGGHVPAG